jgi:hypothetical protein
MAKIRPIANVMKISGSKVPDWILAIKQVQKDSNMTVQL